MARACVGLGANVGDPPAQVARAIAALRQVPGTEIEACSRYYRSAAVGPGPQPDYCNAVCLLRTELPPEALLRSLLEIELRLGRVRPAPRWSPRPIDLDLLCYDDLVVDTPELRLPHPELHRRSFVLVPLAEVAPEWHLPQLGRVSELAAGMDHGDLRPWETEAGKALL